MAKTVLIGIDDNVGYSPEAVPTEVTLAGLLEAVHMAIEHFGADAKVVLHNGQQLGAAFGKFEAFGDEIVISDAEPDAEDDEDESQGTDW